MMFPGGIGRDAASMEQMKKEAALKAKADLTAFILFGFAIEVGPASHSGLCLTYGKMTVLNKEPGRFPFE
uniref:Lipoprotein n=1 Tax=Ascaris lumbricoides TaxID=6252 RepID=A0A0M3IDA8_ASCLU